MRKGTVDQDFLRVANTVGVIDAAVRVAVDAGLGRGVAAVQDVAERVVPVSYTHLD